MIDKSDKLFALRQQETELMDRLKEVRRKIKKLETKPSVKVKNSDDSYLKLANFLINGKTKQRKPNEKI